MDKPIVDLPSPFRRVFLWTAPRSCSNAFERSIRELKSVKVFNEPHRRAYFFGPERRRGSLNTLQPAQSELDDSATYKAVDAELLRHYDGYEAVFAKNPPVWLQGRYEHYVRGSFSLFKHTFLIRHPEKSVPSILRVYKKGGFAATLENNGMKELYDFFRIVQSNLDPHPLIIDADDLLANPRGIMEHYCKETGLPFEEQMLTWEPGEVKDWSQDWMMSRYVHIFKETVMKSSGFYETTRIAAG